GGDDAYEAGGFGVNGGGDGGSGFLYDAAGDDAYRGEREGVNGGGDILGTGFLWDAAGDDAYAAGDLAGNGGASGGAGFLLDAAGDDVYTAGSFGANGGASGLVGLRGQGAHTVLDGGVAAASAGMLLDLAGNDVYVAGSAGTNGGAQGSFGLLLDHGGHDAYDDSAGRCERLLRGAEGHRRRAGGRVGASLASHPSAYATVSASKSNAGLVVAPAAYARAPSGVTATA
ncbi:MAG: hypothetical protein LC624_02945, partial [Halobacteriales archaeon]|nr:hypothetical protein [Halobacteriales archaeon]